MAGVIAGGVVLLVAGVALVVREVLSRRRGDRATRGQSCTTVTAEEWVAEIRATAERFRERGREEEALDYEAKADKVEGEISALRT
jgi:hypothetical protein